MNQSANRVRVTLGFQSLCGIATSIQALGNVGPRKLGSTKPKALG